MTTPTNAAPPDRPLYGASFGEAIRRFSRNYAVFSGRASRSEYWWVVLFFVIVYAVLYVVILALELSVGQASDVAATVIVSVFGGIAGLVFLASIVPSIAIQVRRLHDANLSGGFYFLHLIPYLGSLVVLILTILPPHPLGARFDRGAGYAFVSGSGVTPPPGDTPPPPFPADRR